MNKKIYFELSLSRHGRLDDFSRRTAAAAPTSAPVRGLRRAPSSMARAPTSTCRRRELAAADGRR
eukprot:2595648-Prymnesium_polylepis.1